MLKVVITGKCYCVQELVKTVLITPKVLEMVSNVNLKYVLK